MAHIYAGAVGNTVTETLTNLKSRTDITYRFNIH